MYNLSITSRYKKDLKRAKARGLDILELKTVLTYLLDGEQLPPIYKNHKLTGQYKGLWECHIGPDWLLIYDINKDIKLITLVRTGTHSDLF